MILRLSGGGRQLPSLHALGIVGRDDRATLFSRELESEGETKNWIASLLLPGAPREDVTPSHHRAPFRIAQRGGLLALRLLLRAGSPAIEHVERELHPCRAGVEEPTGDAWLVKLLLEFEFERGARGYLALLRLLRFRAALASAPRGARIVTLAEVEAAQPIGYGLALTRLPVEA
jgi:hypothetical protein